MTTNIKTDVSKYISYLLRHNPEDLRMDNYGFADIDELHRKLMQRYSIDRQLIFEIVEKSTRKRFEIVGNKIRALYGHTISINQNLVKDEAVEILYHGTTSYSAKKILKEGLKSMKRTFVHLSPTIEIAREVGLRRTLDPTILMIDAQTAIRDGVHFYKTTDKVYLCKFLQPKYMRIIQE